MQITTPVITINGSSAKSLAEDYLAARKALNEAIDAFRKIEFHPRDYQQCADGAERWDKARYERDVQMVNLTGVKEYLTEHLKFLCE